VYGSVLVIGGGTAGVRAALDLAKNGVQVVLVEREPVVGGTMAARLSDESETFGFARGMDFPRIGELANHPGVELLTRAEVVELNGEAGSFTATIRQHASFVTDACTRCNRCHSVCPVVVSNPFQSGLTYRKAIYTPFRGALPSTYVIDIESCLNSPPNYLPCQRCVEVCDDHAIDFGMAQQQVLQRAVGAVIVAVGYALADSSPLQRFGYGTHPDILTYMELERLLTPAGPSGGFVEKPSSGNTPDSILFVMSDVSRFAWGCVAAQCRKLIEQDVANLTILHPSETTEHGPFRKWWAGFGIGGVSLVEGELEKVAPQEGDTIRVRFKTPGGEITAARDYDMVVFTSAVRPPRGLAELATVLGIELNGDGFVQLGKKEDGMIATTRPGVYVAGCACGPKDMPESIAESKAAAVYAMRHLERRRAAGESGPANGYNGVMVNGHWLSEGEIRQRLERLILHLTEP
jgi:heterodisulfide reductase subunit A